MDMKKVEALANHIVQECEKRELTIEDMKFLKTVLGMKVDNAIGTMTNPQRFKSE